MSRITRIILAFLAAVALWLLLFRSQQNVQKDNMQATSSKSIRLAAVTPDSVRPLEIAIAQRRSLREYREDTSITLDELARLLWAAQGLTTPDGRRTVPSAGALYPLEVYVVAEKVAVLEPGIYHYRPETHSLVLTRPGAVIAELVKASLSQGWIEKASAVLVIAGDYSRTAVRYGKRAERYVHMEAGHTAQNISLEAVSLGLGTTVVGAFDDTKLGGVLGLPEAQTPLILLPVGHPR